MKPFFLHDRAWEELNTAIAHYENEREGLGQEFSAEVAFAIERILERPTVWPKLSRKARSCVTHRFPYAVIYTMRGEIIMIVAIMHLHRRPGYWKSRIE